MLHGCARHFSRRIPIDLPIYPRIEEYRQSVLVVLFTCVVASRNHQSCRLMKEPWAKSLCRTVGSDASSKSSFSWYQSPNRCRCTMSYPTYSQYEMTRREPDPSMGVCHIEAQPSALGQNSNSCLTTGNIHTVLEDMRGLSGVASSSVRMEGWIFPNDPSLARPSPIDRRRV